MAEVLTNVEKSVIIAALQTDIVSEQKAVLQNPEADAYAKRNIAFRESLITKVMNL